MNPTPPTDDERARFEVACDWFVQLREQPQSTEVISGWLEWLDADPRNQEAFGRARQIWFSRGDGSIRWSRIGGSVN